MGALEKEFIPFVMLMIYVFTRNVLFVLVYSFKSKVLQFFVFLIALFPVPVAPFYMYSVER